MKLILNNSKGSRLNLYKYALLLLAIVSIHFESNASWNRAMLRLREDQGRTITVSIDGKRFNKMGRTITVGDLPVGRHDIKVFRYNSNGHGYQVGNLIYAGKILIKPGRIYYCTVFRNSMDIEENCCVDDYGHWNQNDNWDDWDQDNNRWNNNRKWTNDDRHKGDDDLDRNNDWTNRNDNDNWKNDNRDHWNRKNQDNNYDGETWNNFKGQISNGRFDQLIEQIRKASFESSKVSTANAGLMNVQITVKQLIGILNELSFESTKLDFAKNNYKKLIDKRNFYLINDAFDFQSSKDEINDFISKQ